MVKISGTMNISCSNRFCLNLPQAVVCFDLQKQKPFKAAQTNVALSRVTSIQGLPLSGIFNNETIKAKKRC